MRMCGRLSPAEEGIMDIRIMKGVSVFVTLVLCFAAEGSGRSAGGI